MNFSKEEKIVLLTIAFGILAGIIINFFVHFPQKPQVQSLSASAPAQININTAAIEELSKLPGIGATYAGRIIGYRQEHGGFKNIEELKNVKGIGEKKFEKIKRFVALQ
jgi:competence protein ComEA